MSRTVDHSSALRSFAIEAGSRAPLYRRLAERAADEPEVSALLDNAPPTQQRPVLLFAAVHHLVLSHPASDLARHYQSVTAEPTESDPEVDFIEFVLGHREEIGELIATRRTQTNEIGRSSLVLRLLWELSSTGCERIGLLDVGCSAGLNLLLDHYTHRFTCDTSDRGAAAGQDAAWTPVEWTADEGSTDGPVRPTVALECSLRGLPRPEPHRVAIVERLGIDPEPIDIADTDSTRWLEACVWPDQIDRLARLRGALSIARSSPPPVRRSDAVSGLVQGLEFVGANPTVLPVVINTWVLAYLTESERREYARLIDDLGNQRDLTWIYVEAPDDCPGLDRPADPSVGRLTCVMQVDWRDGRRTVRFRGPSHPHGYWMHHPVDASVRSLGPS